MSSTRQERVTPRVLHILNTARPRGIGIAKIVRTLATRLDTRFQSSAWFVYEDGPLIDWLQSAGIDAKYVPWRPSLTNPWGPLKLWRTCHSEKLDLVHHHSADARVRRIIRQATNAPILLHLHGRAAETAAPVPKKLSTRYADRVITVSQAVSDFTSTPSEVVYTGVELGDPEPKENQSSDIVVGAAGRLIRLKGFDRLIRAMALVRKKSPSVRLEIAGAGEERERLQRLIDELGLNESVRMLGWENDVQAAMKRWQVFAQPSLEEGLGHSILEAMAQRLPVVATAVGGIPEVVVNGETGWLVPNGDESAMAERIAELAANPHLRKAMGERGRSRVESHFSPSAFASRIETIYREMLTGSSEG